MKQYVIDEISQKDAETLKSYFAAHLKKSSIGDVFFLPVEPDVLTDLQKSHTECGPLYFSMELETDKLVVELLIRSPNKMRCVCMGYADEKQFLWLIQYIDAMLDYLGVKI